jgi:ketosteroid isomerase-like protein
MKKNNTVRTIICLVLFIIYTNCKAQTSKGDGLDTVRKVIEHNNVLYFDFFEKKDPAIVNLYTDDACLLLPNEPAKCGKAALTKDFKDTFADGAVSGVKFLTQNIYGDGEAYVTEDGTWQVFDAKGKLIDNGKYLKLWKKTVDGWKIFRDIFNSDNSNR